MTATPKQEQWKPLSLSLVEQKRGTRFHCQEHNDAIPPSMFKL